MLWRNCYVWPQQANGSAIIWRITLSYSMNYWTTGACFTPLHRQDLDAQLARLLATIDYQDLEQLMIVLRQFKQQHVLKVAAADIMGIIPLMVVSDYLTYIAESIVGQVIARSWLMLVEKHGMPPGCQS